MSIKHLYKALRTYRRGYQIVRVKTEEEWERQEELRPPLAFAGVAKELDPEGWGRWLPTVLAWVPDDMRTKEFGEKAKEEGAWQLVRRNSLKEAHENKFVLGRAR